MFLAFSPYLPQNTWNSVRSFLLSHYLKPMLSVLLLLARFYKCFKIVDWDLHLKVCCVAWNWVRTHYQTRSQKFLRAGEVSWNYGTSTNISLKYQKKSRTQTGLFFQNQSNFFDFQKRAGEVSPPSLLVARLTISLKKVLAAN